MIRTTIFTFIAMAFTSSGLATNQISPVKSPKAHLKAIAAAQKLQPMLSYEDADKYASAFVLASESGQCGVPWQILMSIAYNESSLGRHLVNNKSKDYGLMQINRRNLVRYGISEERATYDHLLSVMFACNILKHNKEKYSKAHKYWLGIYRSGTALWKKNIVDNAKQYDKLIRDTAKRIGYNERVHN